MKNSKDEIIDCDKFQIKSNMIHKAVWWVFATGVTITLGLIGVIYANVNSKIDAKADMATVVEMKQDIADIKAGVKRLEDLHIKGK